MTEQQQEQLEEPETDIDAEAQIQEEADLPAEQTQEQVEVETDMSEQTQDQDEVETEAPEQDQDQDEIETEVEASEQTQDQVEAETEVSEQAPDFEPTVESVIEAVLFASDEPLTPNRLADIVGTGVKQIREHVKNLNEKYETNNNAFRIEQIAGGLQMLTLSPYNHWLKKLLRARSDSKLSPAALETLAIVAYKQPVIRADIEAIRGVAAGEVLRSLMYKGLIKIVGRAEVLGRPMLYGTTKKFLEVFGLNKLKDLPKIEELKKPPA